MLSYSQGGRTRFLMLPPHTLAAVRRATERYRTEKARLEERADQGIAELATTLAAARRRA